jgi:hypothetical protein
MLYWYHCVNIASCSKQPSNIVYMAMTVCNIGLYSFLIHLYKTIFHHICLVAAIYMGGLQPSNQATYATSHDVTTFFFFQINTLNLASHSTGTFHWFHFLMLTYVCRRSQAALIDMALSRTACAVVGSLAHVDCASYAHVSLASLVLQIRKLCGQVAGACKGSMMWAGSGAVQVRPV